MLRLNVSSAFPSAITSAIQHVREMVAGGSVPRRETIRLVLEKGVYRESVRYNLSNPLIIESFPGTAAADCVIQVDNCEEYNPGRQNRAAFALGPNTTDVTLRNFTVVNMHEKTVAETRYKGDAAETLVWESAAGTLLCEGLDIRGGQSALYIQGCAWFSDTHISGTTDVVCGEPDTCLFEHCTLEISGGKSRGNAFAVRSRAVPKRPGFVFCDCAFLGEAQKGGALYACRADGSSNALRNWDSVAFLNCTFTEAYSSELLWDDDMALTVYPRGNARCGVREYGSRIQNEDGTLENVDTTKRNVKVYTLTEEDFSERYASRYLILGDTPFAERL